MPGLKRGAGFWTVLALAFSSILVTGLFFGAAVGSKYAGNLVIVSWAVLSVAALYIAACFGELAALFPKSGGVYEYGKQAYGRFFSFIIGWVAWLVGSLTAVLLIVAAINYLIPADAFALKMGVGVFFILALNLIAFFGLEASSFALIAFAVITVAVVLFVVARGFFFFDVANLTPFFSHPPYTAFIALFFIVEGFFGWEAAAYLSEETKNARQVIPKALMISTGVIAVIGLLLYIISLGVIPWEKLSMSVAPLVDISHALLGSRGSSAVSIGIYLSLIGSAAGSIITMPRLILALARDHLFPGQFRGVHKKFKTPHKAIVFQAVILLIMLVMGFGSYKMLLGMLVPLGLFMYSSSMLAVVVLRHKKPDLERPFKAAFGSIGPLIIVLFFLLVVAFWLLTETYATSLLMLSLSLVAAGLPLYLLVELYYDPKMITSVNDLLAYFSLLAEQLSVPRRLVNEILVLIGNVKGKKALDFGCSIGTLTVPLSKAVGKQGLVYAVDFSRNVVKLAEKRIRMKQWAFPGEYSDVRFIHDPDNMRRVHPDIRRADVIVSVGRLSYMQDIRQVLRDLRSVLPYGGKICFVEYGDFFHVLPNVEWMAHNKTVEHLFREAGFAVSVTRRKGLFWNYILIHGAKLGSEIGYV